MQANLSGRRFIDAQLLVNIHSVTENVISFDEVQIAPMQQRVAARLTGFSRDPLYLYFWVAI